MREIIGVFALLPFVTWILTYKKYEDIAAPYNLFSLLYFLNVMIPTVLYMNIDVAKNISEPYIRTAVVNDSTYCIYVVLQTLCYYLVIFGTKLRIGKSYNQLSKDNEIDIVDLGVQKKYRYIGIIMWLIGTAAFFKIMSKVGGIFYFFTHLQYRASLTRNLDLLSWILPFVNYGVLFLVYSYKGTEKPLNMKIIFLIVVSGIMSGLGGRKSLLILLIEVLLLYHYCVKRIDVKKLLRPKYILGIVTVYIFFIVMSKFRTEGAFETFIQNPIAFIKQSNNGILSTIRGESYVTYYMTVIEYFKTNSLWLGKTFLGLITAIIPSSIFPGKPPVDDGTYLYSICQGRTDIIPPMPFSQLNGSSLPLETFGSMYGNFGLIGLIIGMIVLGGIYGYSYRKMVNSSYSMFNVVIYTQIIFTFQLSTLRIFQLFEMVVVFGIITCIVNKKFLWGGVDNSLENLINYINNTSKPCILKEYLFDPV